MHQRASRLEGHRDPVVDPMRLATETGDRIERLGLGDRHDRQLTEVHSLWAAQMTGTSGGFGPH